MEDGTKVRFKEEYIQGMVIDAPYQRKGISGFVDGSLRLHESYFNEGGHATCINRQVYNGTVYFLIKYPDSRNNFTLLGFERKYFEECKALYSKKDMIGRYLKVLKNDAFHIPCAKGDYLKITSYYNSTESGTCSTEDGKVWSYNIGAINTKKEAEFMPIGFDPKEDVTGRHVKSLIPNAIGVKGFDKEAYILGFDPKEDITGRYIKSLIPNAIGVKGFDKGVYAQIISENGTEGRFKVVGGNDNIYTFYNKSFGVKIEMMPKGFFPNQLPQYKEGDICVWLDTSDILDYGELFLVGGRNLKVLPLMNQGNGVVFQSKKRPEGDSFSGMKKKFRLADKEEEAFFNQYGYGANVQDIAKYNYPFSESVKEEVKRQWTKEQQSAMTHGQVTHEAMMARNYEGAYWYGSPSAEERGAEDTHNSLMDNPIILKRKKKHKNKLIII